MKGQATAIRSSWPRSRAAATCSSRTTPVPARRRSPRRWRARSAPGSSASSSPPTSCLRTSSRVRVRPADQAFRFHEGAVFTNILLADEINRASPRTQSALLEAMAREGVGRGPLLPAERAVLRHRHAESGRVPRHVPAARGTDGPVRAAVRARVCGPEEEWRSCRRRSGATRSRRCSRDRHGGRAGAPAPRQRGARERRAQALRGRLGA